MGVSPILGLLTKCTGHYDGVLKREGGGGGVHRIPNQAHTPTQISPNVLYVVRWHKQTYLQSQQCPVCS